MSQFSSVVWFGEEGLYRDLPLERFGCEGNWGVFSQAVLRVVGRRTGGQPRNEFPSASPGGACCPTGWVGREGHCFLSCGAGLVSGGSVGLEWTGSLGCEYWLPLEGVGLCAA